MGNNLEFEVQEATDVMTIALPIPFRCISSSLAYGLCSINMHVLERNVPSLCCARQAWLSYEAMPMVYDNRVHLGTLVYTIETLPR